MPSLIEKQQNSATKQFRDLNPKSEAQYDAAAQSMPGGNTRSVLFYAPFPLTMTRGDGANLWDLDGHEYVDFLGEYTACIFGHSHPLIIAEIVGALKTGLNLSSHTSGEVDLTRAICARFPTFDTVRLTNSGTEANIMALSAARAFTKRPKIVVFAGAYHGGPLSYVGKASAANIPYDVVIAPYNDLAGTRSLLAGNAGEIAAILVEPMLGAGGCIAGTQTFLQGLRDWCTADGALLIFDEVMTSRLHPQGLQHALGIRPDLTTMGKYLGGGMPIGVFGGRADIMAQFDPRTTGHLAHAGTFNNNVLSMRAGLVGLTQVFTQNQATQLTEMGDGFRHRLNQICQTSGLPVQFTGIGSVMNLHTQVSTIDRPEQVPLENGPLKELIFFGMLRRGYYIARRGLIALNVCHTQAHLSGFEAAFKDTLDSLQPFVETKEASGENQ